MQHHQCAAVCGMSWVAVLVVMQCSRCCRRMLNPGLATIVRLDLVTLNSQRHNEMPITP